MSARTYTLKSPMKPRGPEERHWGALNSPIFGKDGKLTPIIHRVEEAEFQIPFLRQAQKDPQNTPLILVIEDNPVTHAFLTKTFRSSFRVVSAHLGHEGVRLAGNRASTPFGAAVPSPS